MKINELENSLTRKEPVIEDTLFGFLGKALSSLADGPGRDAKMKQLAQGTLKVWQLQYQNLVRQGVLKEARKLTKSAILEGILNEVDEVEIDGEMMTKSADDGLWHDDSGDIIKNPTDVKELERRLAIKKQTQQMSPKNQAAANNASKEKTIPKKDPTAAPTPAPADATSATKAKAAGEDPTELSTATAPLDTEKADTGLLDKDGKPLMKDVPKAADPDAGIEPNLLSYRQEFAKFIAKAFRISDVSKVSALTKNITKADPKDEATLLPIIQQVQKIAATDPEVQADLGLVNNDQVDQAALKNALQKMTGGATITPNDLKAITKLFGADSPGQTMDQKISRMKAAGLPKALGLA